MQHFREVNRREFVSAIPAVTSLPLLWATHTALGQEAEKSTAAGPEIIDTNVHLFEWPFRDLKYAHTDALKSKLRRHRITRAWAGSFEAVLHKQLDLANRRLMEECRAKGDGMFVPMGSVNPAWPDWEEDLRRCHEKYRMPGIRLYPAYHGYTLGEPEFARLLDVATQRGMLVQIALRMEDERVHHTALVAPPTDAAPLADVVKKVPQARIQLINSGGALRMRQVRSLVQQSTITFDIADIEANGGVGRLIEGTHPYYQGPIPVERLLFGSHAPFFPCESALFKLFESPLNLEQLEKIMHANARSVLS